MKSQTKRHLEKIIKNLKNKPEIVAVYLFGSYAQGTQTVRSDVDICVITANEITHEAEVDIGSMYSDDIDLVLFKNLPLPLKFRVLREGKELFVIDERKLAFIKSKIIKEYLDYEPVLTRLTNAVLAAR